MKKRLFPLSIYLVGFIILGITVNWYSVIAVHLMIVGSRMYLDAVIKDKAEKAAERDKAFNETFHEIFGKLYKS